MEIENGAAEIGEIEEPTKSKGWLEMLAMSEKAFEDWQSRADNIDKQYANLERLANVTREREFQLFWANVQVLGPSTYAQAPVPVVTPKFKDRRPLNRISSELLERCAIVTLDNNDINGKMLQIRDDMNVVGRGVPWVRMETDEKGKKKACVDYLNRRDFRHDPARTWHEVDWVARCGWLTEDEFEDRFPDVDASDAAFVKRKEDGDTDDGVVKCPVWEIWSKSENLVVWVTEGIEDVLDSTEPLLTLEDFFPCPKPAYSTTQRGSLIPVPDFAFYKDQLEEINELTGRIGALTESLKLRGFYPAGAGELGDAIEAAVKTNTNNQVLVPISNWAMMGTGNPKDIVIWWPIEQVAAVITQLIELRKQLIDDVYQITGLSDIMRGSTKATETLGAQELKSQYGSVRIRDRQNELVRIARDIVRIICEIMAENFDAKSLLEMSQLEIPYDKDIAAQVKPLAMQLQQINQQVQQAGQDPEIQQMAQQNPEKAQEVMQAAQQQVQQIQGQIQKLQETVTIEQIVKFLRDNRTRSFALDIETDSTIAPDENAQKQRATEYMTAMSSFLSQAVPAVQAVPQMAPLMSDMIKFVNSQFRVGREMEATVEEFADQMKQAASQPKANPEADAAAKQAEMLQKKIDAELKALEAKTAAEMATKKAEADAKATFATKEMEAKAQEHTFKMQTLKMERDAKAAEAANRQAQHSMTMEHALASHEQGMNSAKSSHEQKVDADLAANGMPPVAAMEAIVQEMASSRETMATVVAVVAEGQKEVADGLKMLAAVNSAPVKIVSPEGRTFIKQPVVN